MAQAPAEVAPAGAQQEPRPNGNDSPRDGKSVKELLIERRGILRKCVSVYAERLQRPPRPGESGRSPFFIVDCGLQLSQVQSELLEVELELCDRPADRVKLHEEHVARMIQFEKGLEKLWDIGQIARFQVLRYRSARLGAEIALLRERERSADPAK